MNSRARNARGNKVVLVLGGARSGKSGFAGRLAETRFRRPVYLATAEVLDAEMAGRIELHRKARGSRWQCVEEPLDIARVLRHPPETGDGILLDCLTLWLSNVLLKEGEKAVASRKRQLLAALQAAAVPVILVSNEVGMGIVPEHKLGRTFRDLAGWLNQDVAAVADAVVFVVAGLPMVLKGKMDGPRESLARQSRNPNKGNHGFPGAARWAATKESETAGVEHEGRKGSKGKAFPLR